MTWTNINPNKTTMPKLARLIIDSPLYQTLSIEDCVGLFERFTFRKLLVDQDLFGALNYADHPVYRQYLTHIVDKDFPHLKKELQLLEMFE